MVGARIWSLKVKVITVTVILRVAPPYQENRLWRGEESTGLVGERLQDTSHLASGENLWADQVQLGSQRRINLVKISAVEMVWGNLSFGNNSC